MEESQQPQPQQPSFDQPKEQLPNATATLVLGILSIVLGCCCSFFGLIPSIIALSISAKSVSMYKANPHLYEGYGNLNAGRITAFIGLGISILFGIITIIYYAIVGMDEFMRQVNGGY